LEIELEKTLNRRFVMKKMTLLVAVVLLGSAIAYADMRYNADRDIWEYTAPDAVQRYNADTNEWQWTERDSVNKYNASKNQWEWVPRRYVEPEPIIRPQSSQYSDDLMERIRNDNNDLMERIRNSR